MPDFPTLMNFGLATTIVILLLFWGRDGVKALWPAVEARINAKTSKIEEDARTSCAVREMLIRGEERDQRSLNMQSANTLAIAEVAKEVGGLHTGVNRILDHLRDGCECEADRLAVTENKS